MKTQFNIMNIYMKTSSEKEKKLSLALSKLENLNLANPNLKNSLENLGEQRNQLEIEKKEAENKYNVLATEHETLQQKLDNINTQKKNEQKKEIEFSEKIDELNQETDSLLEEIDKWQM